MGQKVNPHGIRVGIIKDWDSRWYADKKSYGENLVEDYKLRVFLKKKLYLAGVAKIEIEKFANKIRLSIHAAKPGIVIGKGGSEIEKLKKDVENLTGKSVILNVIEVKSPDMDAQLVAENIASQLERRISFRKAMQRVSRLQFQVVLAVLKSLVQSSIMRELSRCRHLEQTLTTVLLKLIQLTANLALRFGFIRVKFLQKARRRTLLPRRKEETNNVITKES